MKDEFFIPILAAFQKIPNKLKNRKKKKQGSVIIMAS